MRWCPSPVRRASRTDDRLDLAARVCRGWELLADYAESCDLDAPARHRGRTGHDVLVPVGRWSDSRSLGDVVEDARAGGSDGSTRTPTSDGSGRATQRQQPLTWWLDARRPPRGRRLARAPPTTTATACTPTASPLGALPVRTFLHAAVYQLAVVALDLEPCAAEPVPAELLALGLVALVDSAGCLAARRGLHASLVADARGGDAPGADAVGVWGFGATDGAWRVAELGEPDGPAVTASARVVLDITAGRTANVPGLVTSGRAAPARRAGAAPPCTARRRGARDPGGRGAAGCHRLAQRGVDRARPDPASVRGRAGLARRGVTQRRFTPLGTSRVPDQSRAAAVDDVEFRPAVGAASPMSEGST